MFTSEPPKEHLKPLIGNASYIHIHAYRYACVITSQSHIRIQLLYTSNTTATTTTAARICRTAHPNLICTPHLGASTDEAQVNVARDVAVQMCDVFDQKDYIGMYKCICTHTYMYIYLSYSYTHTYV